MILTKLKDLAIDWPKTVHVLTDERKNEIIITLLIAGLFFQH